MSEVIGYIYFAEELRGKVTTEPGKSALFTLPPGRYDVHARAYDREYSGTRELELIGIDTARRATSPETGELVFPTLPAEVIPDFAYRIVTMPTMRYDADLACVVEDREEPDLVDIVRMADAPDSRKRHAEGVGDIYYQVRPFGGRMSSLVYDPAAPKTLFLLIDTQPAKPGPRIAHFQLDIGEVSEDGELDLNWKAVLAPRLEQLSQEEFSAVWTIVSELKLTDPSAYAEIALDAIARAEAEARAPLEAHLTAMRGIDTVLCGQGRSVRPIDELREERVDLRKTAQRLEREMAERLSKLGNLRSRTIDYAITQPVVERPGMEPESAAPAP